MRNQDPVILRIIGVIAWCALAWAKCVYMWM